MTNEEGSLSFFVIRHSCFVIPWGEEDPEGRPRNRSVPSRGPRVNDNRPITSARKFLTPTRSASEGAPAGARAARAGASGWWEQPPCRGNILAACRERRQPCLGTGVGFVSPRASGERGPRARQRLAAKRKRGEKAGRPPWWRAAPGFP